MSAAPDVTYSIWVDGLAYCGESDTTEEAPATTGAWWLQSPVSTRHGLAIGTGPALAIGDRITLKSHVERLMTRHREGKLPFTEITIRRTTDD